MTVAIMRSVLQISEDDRNEFVAQQVDEDMRTEIRRHMYHNDIRPLLPKEHPLFEPREKIPSETPPVVTEPPVNQIEQLKGAISGGVKDGAMSAVNELKEEEE
jgi:hypothetical protein